MTKKYKKNLLLFFIALFLIIGSGVLAADVSGYAWSENIGWISFRNNAVPYGVNIDNTTGIFSGYAWSENIGWISFEPASVAGCPSGSCQGVANLVSGNISGWARACSVFAAGCSGALKPSSVLGDWEGWVNLRGLTYGASVNDTVSPSRIDDWAWGDTVIGWVSFNSNNTGGATPPYGPVTPFVPNAYPNAVISGSNPASGQAYQGESLTLINGSNDPDGNNEVVLSQWFTKPQGASDGSYTLQYFCNVAPALCNYSINTNTFSPSNWYTVKLRVEDSGGLFSEDTRDFYVLKDISASFECSLDNVIWEDCPDLEPSEGDVIYLKDKSSASEDGNIVSRIWSLGGIPFNSGNDSSVSLLAVFPSMVLDLTVQDDNGRSDTATETILGIMPLPTWWEIPPF